MAQFRKKPVVVEAYQWDGVGVQPDCPAWLRAAVAVTSVRRAENEQNLEIDTLEGVMTAQPRDWIIRGVKGELYPCKPDIFAATYDSVDPAYADHQQGVA